MFAAAVFKSPKWFVRACQDPDSTTPPHPGHLNPFAVVAVGDIWTFANLHTWRWPTATPCPRPPLMPDTPHGPKKQPETQRAGRAATELGKEHAHFQAVVARARPPQARTLGG